MTDTIECCDKWWAGLDEADKMYIHLLHVKVMGHPAFKKMMDKASSLETGENIRRQHESAFGGE